ncbi:MAG: YfgM family protein [Gammaproteobacteria bacterium]
MNMHSSEEEQLAALALWWRRWRIPVLGVLVSAAIGIGLFQYWKWHQTEQLTAAYSAYESQLIQIKQLRNRWDEYLLEQQEQPASDETESASDTPEPATQEELLNALNPLTVEVQSFFEEQPQSGYAWLLMLSLSELTWNMGQTETSATLLRQGIEATDRFWTGDEHFNGIFRIYLARQLWYDKEYDASWQILESPNLEYLSGLSNELKGDLMVAQGNLEQARELWDLARQDTSIPTLLDTWIGIKTASWGLMSEKPITEIVIERPPTTPEPAAETPEQSKQQ